tara:strand:+ start:1451 stop:1969 length:519 start_codon:yes stop_codon:yes gene_type:complete
LHVAVIDELALITPTPPIVALALDAIVELALEVALPRLIFSLAEVILAVAVKAALDDCTRLQVAVVVDDTLIVAAPLVSRDAVQVIVALGETVAEPSLTLEPLALEVAVVVDVPLINAEPSGTRLALHVVVELEDKAATPFSVAAPVMLIEALALEVAAPSSTSPVPKARRL